MVYRNTPGSCYEFIRLILFKIFLFTVERAVLQQESGIEGQGDWRLPDPDSCLGQQGITSVC